MFYSLAPEASYRPCSSPAPEPPNGSPIRRTVSPGSETLPETAPRPVPCTSGSSDPTDSPWLLARVRVRGGKWTEHRTAGVGDQVHDGPETEPGLDPKQTLFIGGPWRAWILRVGHHAMS